MWQGTKDRMDLFIRVTVAAGKNQATLLSVLRSTRYHKEISSITLRYYPHRMASQNVLAAPIASAPAPTSFRIDDVDGHLKPASSGTINAQAKATTKAGIQPASGDPPLGALANFKGVFTGKGFNTIFRPNSGPATGTTFPKPVTPPPPAVPNENVLQLNLTTETLSFEAPLGNVPNRGLGQQAGKPSGQGDIFLNGVPYVQRINDVTNAATGKADFPNPQGIHFEPGLFMAVPATTDPAVGASIVRMGSIPHGTTINAQALDPVLNDDLGDTITVLSGPTINPVDITPFPIGNPATKITFASQTAANDATPRLPQDLSKFIEQGTITQEILSDPNTILRKAIQGQDIVQTIVFTVSTTPQDAKGVPANPGLGGGTANMAMLEGEPDAANPKSNANADAAQMSAIFWIETVRSTLTIPTWVPAQGALRIRVPAPNADSHTPPGPVFRVQPPHAVREPVTIAVEWTQLQYSQNVFLNFANLTWPHVSVATLVPAAELEVPDSVWVGLKGF